MSIRILFLGMIIWVVYPHLHNVKVFDTGMTFDQLLGARDFV